MTVLLVAIGAAVGASARYLVDRSLRRGVIAWGTLIVNVAGSLLLGFVTASAVESDVAALVGVGFCGALTTFSTFSYETLQLFEDGAPHRAWWNIAANLGLGAVAVSAGWWLGS